MTCFNLYYIVICLILGLVVMEAVARAKTAITPAAPRVAQVHLKARLLQVAGMVTGLKIFTFFSKHSQRLSVIWW